MTEEPVLMAVFAHPDDEAFGAGGTLTKYAAEGCVVHLVTATRGEAGQISDGQLATQANLPDVRERELRCACEVYGIEPPHFMGYMDGQLTVINQGQAVGKLVRLIRNLFPQVVVTFGPDGIYGHYDHIAVHRWTTIAVKLAADATCFPDQLEGSCQIHQVDKLYYNVLPQQSVEEMPEHDMPAAVMMDGVPFPFVGYTDQEITSIVDVTEYVEQKLAGIRCHRTQVGEDSPYLKEPEEAKGDAWFRQETFILARSSVGQPQETEADLFAGLR